MSGATAQELAVRTAVATVADTATLLQKVDSPGRLYAPVTKVQLRLDMGLSPADAPVFDGATFTGPVNGITLLDLEDTPDSYDSADIGKVLIVKNDLSGLEFTDFNLDNWDIAYSWGDHSGLYDASGTAASTMSTHLDNFVHGNISHANRTELDKLTDGDHDVISSGNPHSVTPTELSLVIGTNVQAYGAGLDDLSALGAPASDGQFIVATGSGVFAFEKDNVARTSLGLGTGNSPEFTAFTVGQGTINNSPGVPAAIATKGYVDSLGGGGSTFWTSVAVVSTADVDLSNGLENGDTIDGWTLVTGDRVLLKDQSDATQNGLYVAVASGAASRAADANTAEEIISRKCIILHGDTHKDKLFFCASAPITLGVTEIEFKSLAGGGVYGVVELLGEEYEVGGEWASPGSVNDLHGDWDAESNTIDENTASFGRNFPGPSSWSDPLEFSVTECESSKFRVYAKCDRSGYGRIRGHYYDGSWHTVDDFAIAAGVDWYDFPFGGVKTITKIKIDVKWPLGYYEGIDLHEVEHWDISSTAQHKITLAAGVPTSDFIIYFPNDDGAVNQAMLSNGSGVLSWGGHDDLADFAATEHFLQTAITNVSTALSTGLLKVTTGTGALTVVTDASGNWNTAFNWGDHSGLYDATGTAASAISTHLGNFAHGDIATNKSHVDTTHDYSFISGNDGATNVTAAQLEELSNGSETTLHSHAGGGGGVDTFIELTDTPAGYDSADIGKYVKVKDDLSGLEFDTPADGAAFTSKCSAWRNGAQAIVTATWTKVALDTEDYDTDSEFDHATLYRFQPDVTGYYAISAGVMILSLAQGALFVAAIYKNGTTWKKGINVPGGAQTVNASLACDMYLLDTDYIELWVYHTHGSNRDIGATDERIVYLDIHRFG